jgi:hypothetical protein
MSMVHVESVGPPFNRAPADASRIARVLLARAEMMGLLPEGVEGATRLDSNLLEDLADALRSAGVATAQADRLESARGKALAQALQETLAAVESSPNPAGEWAPVREMLGDDDLLSVLVGGISPSSLRRYASGERDTPDEVAWRLHLVARIISSIRGSYNGYGIRRWFERPRSQLDGKTPGRRLVESANEDEAGPVVELADALFAPGFAT